jgi:hypothetical protein
MSAPLFVGLDVAQRTFTAVLLDGAGQPVRPPRPLVNQRPDVHAFAEELADLMRTGRFDALLIGSEAPSVYGGHLQFFLADYEPLHPFHPQIYVLAHVFFDCERALERHMRRIMSGVIRLALVIVS